VQRPRIPSRGLALIIILYTFRLGYVLGESTYTRRHTARKCDAAAIRRSRSEVARVARAGGECDRGLSDESMDSLVGKVALT
jgi:hypothetical protein